MAERYLIRDLGLAPSGHVKIEWVKTRMPILRQLEEEFKERRPFTGKTVAMCLHLEAKTAYLAKVVQAGGAEVVAVASNPLSTQDDVVAALVSDGIQSFAWYGATESEYHMHLKKAVECRPDLVVDDGGDLVSLLHNEYQEQLPRVIGGCEETTTGILRLKAMERDGVLSFPMMAVNNAYCKFLFDNRYGTGQSVWDAIMRTTNLVVAGKSVVVVGYGWCGKGVALRAKGLGARVIICEVDPIRANEALMDGFQVMPLLAAAREGDFFITVTGSYGVIRDEHFRLMKDGAILANAGHFDVEISKPDLAKLAVSRRMARPNVEEFILDDGRRLFLLAEGRLVNLAAGDGHPAEIMDLSFALQALSLLYLLENQGRIGPGVHPVPAEIDRRVAAMRLDAIGVTIDTLTRKQEEYLASWRG